MTSSRKRRAPLHPVPRIHLMTGRKLGELRPRRGETIARFHARAVREGALAGLPTIVAERVNGDLRPILKADWHRRIGARIDLVLISAPLGGGMAGGGGGSKGVAGIVGMVALMALAPIAAGALAGAIGLGAAATSIISALIIGGGAYLLSHFLTAKRGARSQALEYSVDLKGNQARTQQPIPVQYGRVKFFPDLAAPTYSDYSGTDQVFHALYSLGCGDYAIEEIGVANTPIWTAAGGIAGGFPNFQFEYVAPGANCSLFPTSVYAAPEVSGQTLPDPYGTRYEDGSVHIGPNGQMGDVEWLGPFTANPSGTSATLIALDLVWTGGLYTVDAKTGNHRPTSCNIVCWYRSIDDRGLPTSGWIVGLNRIYTRETQIPLRITETIAVAAPGRFEVRLARTGRQNYKNAVDAVTWAALKTYLQGPNAVPYAARLAVRMLADKQLAGYASQQIYVIATRKIPVYNPSTGAFVSQASQSPIWATLDVWHNADYGGDLPLSKVDLVALVQLDALCASRGDKFNYRFTSQMPVAEAIATCLRGILAQPVFQWDQFSIVRDQPRALPRLVLTDNEITRGSLEITYTLKDGQTSDGVIVEYIDETTWQEAEVTSRAAGVVLKRPTRVKVPGVTDRRQATVVARYLAAVNEFRRITATLQTEAEGRLVRRGDLIAVQSELPMSWGQATRLASFDGGAVLTVETPLDWSGGASFWLLIRKRDGTGFGPVKCARGAGDTILVVDHDDLVRVQGTAGMGSLADALARGPRQDPASIAFSAGQPTQFAGLLSESGQGDAENTFRLTLVNDAPEVYTIDGTAIDPLPDPSSLVLPPIPGRLAGVAAYLGQENTVLMLYASWRPDPVSVSYAAQISYDELTWYTAYPGGEVPSFAAGPIAPDTPVYLRIRGTSAKNLPGPWTETVVGAAQLILQPSSLGYVIQYEDLSAPVFEALALEPLTQIEDVAGALTSTLMGAVVDRRTLAQDTARAHAKLEEIAVASATAGAALASLSRKIAATVDDNKAEVNQVLQVQADRISATATALTSLSATVKQNTADITKESQARATGDQAIASDLTKLDTAFKDYRGTVSASFSSEAQARSSADGALSGRIDTVTAMSSAGTANGAISWRASSGINGLSAAYSIYLSVSGLTNADAGFYMGVDGAGTSKVVVTAGKFVVQDSGLAFAPFGVVGGVVYLQGVTKVSSTISSQAVNNIGQPVLSQDFVNGSLTFWDNS